MTIESLIKNIALIVGFISSLWFIKGTVSLNGKSINQIASSYWDQNPYLENSLVSQRVEYILGALFLCVSFSLQLLGSLIPTRYLQSNLLPLETSIYLLLDTTIATLFLSWALHVFLKRRTQTQIELATQEEHEQYSQLKS